MDQEDFFGRREAVQHLTFKFNALLLDSEPHFSRLRLPLAVFPSVPLQPGIFKGTNGFSGIQLLTLSYKDENTVIGSNITVTFLFNFKINF